MDSSAINSRRELEEHARKNHILDVAERLFAQDGFHHTTVARVAKESEFGVGTIYKYFADKNGLLQSLLDSRLIPHYQDIETVLFGSGSAIQLIGRFMDCYFESVQKRGAFFRVWCQDLLPTTTPAWNGAVDFQAIDERRAKIFARIEELFDVGVHDGEFVEVNATHLAAALVGMLQSFVLLTQHGDSGEWGTQRAKEALKLVLFEKVLLGRGEDLARKGRGDDA